MKRKYRNTPVVMDGIRFDSKKEAKRWGELVLLERHGEICNLRRQVIYPFLIDGMKICSYTADFKYENARSTGQGTIIVEDVKSPATRKNPVYRIKKKLMKAIHGIEILET